ncbi:MAG TPA: adenylate/guanylate cyclase domain-containing protein [Longimicrobiales bacterium]|nr:adenylate/guanylate cyclase domain-containing protein [Longimicrobiales bacterium]
MEGERKFATVLFADVVRSTALAEQMDPEDWAAVMNGAFAFMNGAVSRFGGTVARLMGDAVLAFFGAPVAHEDDAERAVRAGLAMMESAAEYAATIRARHGVDFGLRVGINTGTTVVAFMGDEVKAEYTAMGDTANVAARLQSVAQAGTVLISGDTYRLVRGLFDVEDHGSVELKGKQEPVDTYRVLSVKAQPASRRGLEGLVSPLVGRGAELNRLRAAMRALSEGAGSVVAVVGEAGIGKSRLLAELRAEAAEAGMAWYEGKAISYGQALAYHPWWQLGREMLGAEETDTPADVRQRLSAFTERLSLPVEHLPLLQMLMAVETEMARGALADLDGDTLVRQIANAIIAALRGAIHEGGAPRPHVLVFDDLHWADGASLELLTQVASIAMSEPLLLACVLRPDRNAPSWSLLDRLKGSLSSAYVQIDLEPLDSARAGELLRNLLRIEDLPESVRALILKRSEGNPFFLEEVLRSLIDSGHVVRDNGHWRANREIVQITIPETLAGVLSGRIDRLPEPTKRVAQTASVLGRTFAYRALASVCRAAPPAERIENVDSHLGTLTYEELVRERARQPEREYTFKHALTQEAAYGLLLKKRRRELHVRAGNVLEELYPERVEELAPVLAHHFAEGGDAQRTATYSMRAADRALRLFALREGLDHYEQAYQALNGMADPPAEQLCDAILGWTWVKYKLHEYDAVIDRLRQSESIARARQDKLRLARTLSWIGTLHVLQGFPSRGADALVESNALAGELGDEHLIILPFFMTTEFLMDKQPRKAAQQLAEIIDMARRHNLPEIEGHALASKAVAHARLGEFDEADEYIRQALEAAPSGGHKVKEADVHIGVGLAYVTMGETAKGLEHTRIGLEMSERMNALECVCAAAYGLGLSKLEQKEMNDALTHFARSLKLADDTGWRGYVNRIQTGVARAEFANGDHAAVAALERTRQNAEKDNDHFTASIADLDLAADYAELGDTARARESLDRALAFFRAGEMKVYVARALEIAARLADTQQRPEDARAARAEATALRASFRKREPARPTT